MTGLLHEQEFSRRTFLKGGGALVVGFSFLGAAAAGKAGAAAGESPYASNGPADMYEVDSWLRVHSDNTASLYSHSIELGQGAPTGLLQIAADELDMDVSQMIFVTDDTNVMPDTGRTAGSKSIKSGGPKVRAASAYAKQALLGLASAQLGVPVASLSVKSGVVSGGGKSVTYADLLGDKQFNVRMPASLGFRTVDMPADTSTGDTKGLVQGTFPTKSPDQYRVVGTRVPRLDIPAKVTGAYVYVHNIRVPGMLHGRIVRPRGQGAWGGGTAPAIVSVDESSISHIPNARVLRRGNFLGVVAPREYDAIQAAAQLKVKWADPPAIPGAGNLFANMRAQDGSGQAPARIQAEIGDVDRALASAAHVVSETYKFNYNNHGVIGPSCAVADVTPNGALILSSSQDSYVLRSKLQPLLGLPLKAIRVRYFEGSSSYGCSNCRYETSEAAAVMSQLAGTPVRLQFMRWDEHGWDNYAPAVMIDLRGGVDAGGALLATFSTHFQIPTYSVTNTPEWDTTAQQVGYPLPTPNLGSADQTAQTQYAIPNRRVMSKSLPLFNNYFRTATMRAPGAIQSTFAFEQLIDELAHAANMDPFAFRVKNLAADPANRMQGVATALQTLSNWKPKVAASSLSNDDVVTGRGVAFAPYGGSYAAVVADVEVNKKTGKVTAKQMFTAQDAGLTINPALVENQMMGSVIQATSRALLEEVRFDTSHVTSLDWTTYPILRFKDSPTVATAVVQRTDQASGGSGEIPTPSTVAAIANAFFDATGVRIREAPITPGRVRATLKAAAVA
jgi:nicotinate dehydrogenase subunit B